MLSAAGFHFRTQKPDHHEEGHGQQGEPSQKSAHGYRPILPRSASIATTFRDHDESSTPW